MVNDPPALTRPPLVMINELLPPVLYPRYMVVPYTFPLSTTTNRLPPPMSPTVMTPVLVHTEPGSVTMTVLLLLATCLEPREPLVLLTVAPLLTTNEFWPA